MKKDNKHYSEARVNSTGPSLVISTSCTSRSYEGDRVMRWIRSLIPVLVGLIWIIRLWVNI